MKSTFIFKIVIIISVLSISSLVFSEDIIFQDNFDDHPDWELTQPKAPTALSVYSGEETIPSGWHSYYIAGSYYTDPGKNSIILSKENARDGKGKCLTFWNESDTRGDGWASDNQLGLSLPDGYNELYVRFYIKFQLGWKWQTSNNPFQKFFRITHYHGGSPYLFFEGGNQHPLFTSLLAKWDGSANVSQYLNYRYENVYYPNSASPSHTTGDTFYFGSGNYSGTGQTFWDNGMVGDGKWHCWEFYVKMNSGIGIPDGIIRFWHDGSLIAEVTDLAWSDEGSQVDPRLNWNYLTIGGNSFNHFAVNEDEAEQWYAIDDFVVSTKRIGPLPQKPANVVIK